MDRNPGRRTNAPRTARRSRAVAGPAVRRRMLAAVAVMALVASGPMAGAALAEDPAAGADPEFVTTWDTSLIDGTSIELFFGDEGTDVDVDWGDGTTTNGVTGPVSHTFDADGTYTVTVVGTFETYSSPFDFPRSNAALLSVDAWGPTGTVSLARAFAGASNLAAVVEPPATVTDISGLFWGAEVFNHDIGDWDTSNITTMSRLFGETDAFNQDIGGWDTSSVTDMNWAFMDTAAFNQDIGGWDTSNVTTMHGTFGGAEAFNQDIGGWDTSSVESMFAMFYGASAFNQDLSDWCVSTFPGPAFNFDTATDAWTLPDSRPVWGTCPRGEDERDQQPAPDTDDGQDPAVEEQAPDTDDEQEPVEEEAPETPTVVFSDVLESSVHAVNIDRLIAADITRGCGGELFCPGDAVTRQQMASFLTRALDLAVPDEVIAFSDVDVGGVHGDAVQALAAAEVTLGCGEGLFCPGDPVTREQMASFLTRALDLAVPDEVIAFADVDEGGVHGDAVQALAAAEVTLGCGEGLFCPGDPVTREQMASFLVRALDL